nr:unnamed protein product [Callosobruchus analis]
MSQMSNDIFQILDCNHSKFLEPYTDQSNGKITEVELFRQSLECRNILQQINDICNSYTIGNNCAYFSRLSKEEAARKICNFFYRLRNRTIFAQTKQTLYRLSRKDPIKILKLVNTSHAEIFEKSMCKLIFRLEGSVFPPSIVYKIFTDRHHLVLQNPLHTNMVIVNGSLGWFYFNIYKCCSCKSKVKPKPMHMKKSKKKRKEDREISWINKMYG